MKEGQHIDTILTLFVFVTSCNSITKKESHCEMYLETKDTTVSDFVLDWSILLSVSIPTHLSCSCIAVARTDEAPFDLRQALCP
jgi:hypothetical protein